MYFIYIKLFRSYPPSEKGVTLYWNKFDSPQLKDALCQDFLISSMYFRYFLIISP